MTDHQDDDGTARIFAALCDPLSLPLLLHALEAGEYDLDAARERETADVDAAARLERLVDVGLLVRPPAAGQRDVYRVADAAAVARLLAAVRQLGARRRHG